MRWAPAGGGRAGSPWPSASAAWSFNVGAALHRLSPRVACRNKWARIEALQRNQAFLDQYRGARADHLAGRDALFPPGTWWLCRFAGLKSAELGSTAPPS